MNVDPESSFHPVQGGGAGPRIPPAKSEIKNKIRKTTKRIQAICDDSQATPTKPKAPAMRAIIKKSSASRNMTVSFHLRENFFNEWVLLSALRL